MTILLKLFSRLPLWLAHALGWFLGWTVFLLSAVYRRRFVANARQAGFSWRQWLGAVAESGKLVAELPRLWWGAAVPVQWSGESFVTRALAQGKGVVFLTPHLGCFEITAQAYAERFGQHGSSITVLFRPARQPWLRALVAGARARPGLHTAPTSLSGVKQMIKALRAGQSVGLLPDQVPPQGMGVTAAFFGRDAYTMTLAARLVQQSAAVLLLAWGERLSWGRGYRVHVLPLAGSLPLEPVAAATCLNAALARLIAVCPAQYLWGYARYKLPRDAV